MSSFSFHLPTRIEAGEGSIERTGALTREVVGGQRALVITDAGIERIGLAEKVRAQLVDVGYEVSTFDGVEPNPKDIDCERGGEAARQWGAEVIVAVGGGSVIDTAKAIAVLQTHEGRLQDVAGRDRLKGAVTPLVVIPTTAGTGSEVTRSSVVTDTVRRFKMTVKDVRLAPALAIVDPAVTYALPPQLTASTGMDALVHAIEAYTCRRANPIADALAAAAMRHIYPHLREAVHHGENREARFHMMIGSLIAGMAFSHADVAAVHCMAEALGGRYDTPHGVANSIFLPYVTEYNVSANVRKHAEVARFCGIADDAATDEAAAAALVDALKGLAQDIGIPAFHNVPGVDPDDFAALAEASFENGSTPSNCREIHTEQYLKLFEKAYKEGNNN
jgi:alcohol dehydrogenase